MFKAVDNFQYTYAPLISVRPSELRALEELADKTKDLILPVIALRGWVNSQKLENSVPRIEKAFGNRRWIADIDRTFIETKKPYKREVFQSIEDLLKPDNAYNNWFEYLREIPNAIPTLQVEDLSHLEAQATKLASLDRGLVLRLQKENITRSDEIISRLTAVGIDDLFVLFDFEQINKETLVAAASLYQYVESAYNLSPDSLFAISCTSFPSDFSNEYRGENPIFERQLYIQIFKQAPKARKIYSDRASARYERAGGGGIPYPRIDYPLKNDWRFVREWIADPDDYDEDERRRLYAKAAAEVMKSDYWAKGLHVWGTQQIELTTKGDGINSPTKATAARINIHMHQQTYYELDIEDINTDEDWID